MVIFLACRLMGMFLAIVPGHADQMAVGQLAPGVAHHDYDDGCDG